MGARIGGNPGYVCHKDELYHYEKTLPPTCEKDGSPSTSENASGASTTGKGGNLHRAHHGAAKKLAVSSGRTSPVAPKLVTPDQLSRDERAWSASLKAKSGRAFGSSFHKSGDAVHDNFAGVLGKLSPESARSLFPSSDKRALLKKACVHAFLDRVDLGLNGKFKRAEGRLRALISSPKKRAALWGQAKTAKQRTQLLSSLGVAPKRAAELAKASRLPDAELLGALKETLTKVEKLHTSLRQTTRLSVMEPALALGLIARYGGEAKRARQSLGIRPGSFADRALAEHRKEGIADKKLNETYQVAFGILAGLVSGGIFTVGVAGAGVVGGLTAGVMKANGLVAQLGQRDMARLAEQLRIADKGSYAKAKLAYSAALKHYVAGILAGAAAGTVAKYIEGKGAIEVLKRVPESVEHVLTKLLLRSKLPADAAEKIAEKAVEKGVHGGLDALADHIAEALVGHHHGGHAAGQRHAPSSHHQPASTSRHRRHH